MSRDLRLELGTRYRAGEELVVAAARDVYAELVSDDLSPGTAPDERGDAR